MDGFDYMDFLVPGLILMSVINASYQNVVGSFFGAKWGKSIEELLVSPTPIVIILLAYITGGVARGALVGLIVTGVSLFFSDLQIHSLAVLFSIVMLTAILFSLCGLMNAIFAKTFDDVSIIPTFVLLPLTYLGVLFDSFAPGFLATGIDGQPDSLHGQRLSIRFFGDQRCKPVRLLRHDSLFYHLFVYCQSVPAGPKPGATGMIADVSSRPW